MDHQQHESKPDTIEVTVAAMERLGDATAAAIAADAGFAYSTVTPKLRALEDAGRAERLRTDEGRTLWRLIPADQAADTPAAADVDVDVDTMAGKPDDEKPAPPACAEATTDDGDGAARATEPAGDEQPETAPDAAAAEPATAQTGVDLASDQAGDDGTDTAEPATTRRGKGALREQVLKVLQEHPDTAYKVGELSKLLDGASQGAIANALHKLTGEATVTQTVERPATFQAA